VLPRLNYRVLLFTVRRRPTAARTHAGPRDAFGGRLGCFRLCSLRVPRCGVSCVFPGGVLRSRCVVLIGVPSVEVESWRRRNNLSVLQIINRGIPGYLTSHMLSTIRSRRMPAAPARRGNSPAYHDMPNSAASDRKKPLRPWRKPRNDTEYTFGSRPFLLRVLLWVNTI